jgi:hypothetical protein
MNDLIRFPWFCDKRQFRSGPTGAHFENCHNLAFAGFDRYRLMPSRHPGFHNLAIDYLCPR